MPSNTDQPHDADKLASSATSEPDQCLSVKDVCAYLSIGKTTFNKLRRQGEFETFLGSSKRLTKRSEVDAYIERQLAKERRRHHKPRAGKS